ncbi:MAG: putative sulfate exporter family transporter, partial [Caldimonas sp.]
HNPVLVAMLCGLLVGNTFGCPESLRPGLDFSKRYLLRLGVMLVGFRITVRLLSELGVVPIGIAAVELVTVILVMRWVAVRVFKLEGELALLVAAGTAICGAAAILCVAALTRSREQSVGIAIALITLAGTLALLVYPVAFVGGAFPAFDDRLYGIFVGSSIYELAQVYGASYAVSDGALNTATLVKLSKVLMLVPLLLTMSVVLRRRGGDDGSGNPTASSGSTRFPFPWFVIGFVLVMLFNSSITVHPQVRRLILDADQLLFMMVMIALGLTTRLSRLAEGGVGWRLIGLGLFGLALSTLVAYALVASMPRPVSANAQPAESAMLSSAGGRVFASVGCAKCHVPSLRDRDGTAVTLYSDLLLHDMGPLLDDKIQQGDATGAEWRTTPLVSIRTRQRFLHDGRAASLRDAIFAHGGEGLIVRDRFLELDEAEQQKLYAFLATL